MLVNGTNSDAISTIHTIRTVYPSYIPIEFTTNKVRVHFLDIWIGFQYNFFLDNSLHFSVYEKPFNTYSYPNYSSNHPEHVQA